MLALFIFMAAALALAAFLVVSSLRTSREEERALILAREREHTARLVAQQARETRARWEAKIAEDQLAAATSDPRGKGDGVGRDGSRHTGRFRRGVPAPFTAPR